MLIRKRPSISLPGQRRQFGRKLPGLRFLSSLKLKLYGATPEEIAALQTFYDATSVGPNVVVNGGFDSDTVWAKAANWTIADGVAVADESFGAGNLDQAPILTLGKFYQLTFDIVTTNGGLLMLSGLGGGSINIEDHGMTNSPGTKTATLEATSTTLRFRGSSVFTGSIDNVLVEEIDVWTDKTGWFELANVGTWYGVTSVGGNVTAINLNTNNLVGNVASTLNDLTYLTILKLSFNSLTTSIDTSKNVLLTEFLCYNNSSLTSIDTSKNVLLTDLRCSNNYLPELGLSANIAIRIVYCGYNLIVNGIDLSTNTAIETFNCVNNGMSEAGVDVTINSIHTNRANYTYANPMLSIGTLNAAPSVTGLNQIVELTTDPNSEGFNLWTITSTAPSLGAEEISAFVNNASYSYETFTTAGNVISLAANAAGYGIAGATVSLTTGNAYKLTVDLTLNSGTTPIVGMSTGFLLPTVNYFTPSVGYSEYYFTQVAGDVALIVRSASGQFNNFSMAVSLKEIT